MATLLLGPPIIYLVNPVAIANISDIYKAGFELASKAGFLGSIVGVALVYFVGIALDGLNVIARRRRTISRLKRFVGLMWGYRNIIEHIEATGIRSQLPTKSPIEEDIEYSRQIIWYAENPSFGAVRGWEFFLSFSFTLFTLTLKLLFWVLVAVSLVAWLDNNVVLIRSLPWLVATAVGYILLVPGDIAHTYARVNAEEAIRIEFERSQRETSS